MPHLGKLAFYWCGTKALHAVLPCLDIPPHHLYSYLMVSGPSRWSWACLPFTLNIFPFLALPLQMKPPPGSLPWLLRTRSGAPVSFHRTLVYPFVHELYQFLTCFFLSIFPDLHGRQEPGLVLLNFWINSLIHKTVPDTWQALKKCLNER